MKIRKTLRQKKTRRRTRSVSHTQILTVASIRADPFPVALQSYILFIQSEEVEKSQFPFDALHCSLGRRNFICWESFLSFCVLCITAFSCDARNSLLKLIFDILVMVENIPNTLIWIICYMEIFLFLSGVVSTCEISWLSLCKTDSS